MAWYDFLSDIDWGGVAKAAAPLVAPVVGTWMGSQANDRAAQTAQQTAGQQMAQLTAANQLATQTAQQTAEQQTAQLAAANQRAQERFAPMVQQTSQALPYLQSVMARGATLTPEQQASLTQNTRDFARGAQRKFNSGRAYTAMANRFQQGNEQAMQESNRNQSDRAAGAMAGTNLAAINAMSGADQNFGRNIASITGAAGEASASAAQNLGRNAASITGTAGETAINADLANAKLYGKAAGDILTDYTDRPIYAINAAATDYLKNGRRSDYAEK